MTGLVDIHCHLYEPDYDFSDDTFANELKSGGIEKLICAGCDIDTSLKTVDIAKRFDFIYAQVGFHPCDIGNITSSMWEQMKRIASQDKVVAIGEIGLDYYWDSSSKENQRYWFEKQIEFANLMNLPVVIHSRSAIADTMKILQSTPPSSGVLHCFSGSVETMREMLKTGMSISLGGVVTFKNAKDVVNCARDVPIDRLMLETDCPYLSPEPHRGKINRPDYVSYVAEKIAEIRGTDGQQIADATRRNAEMMFKI